MQLCEIIFCVINNWTEVRFRKYKITDFSVWIGYNTLHGFLNKERFNKQSFSNYEWSILDIKYPENSKFLYGKNIRKFLPNIDDLDFDYDDILARSFYHLENCLEESKNENIFRSKIEFTKSVFKLGFYICVFFDKKFHYTSIKRITKKIKELINKELIDQVLFEFLKKSILFRRKKVLLKDFSRVRSKYFYYLLSIISKGILHKKMNYNEIIEFFKSFYGGFPNLLNLMKKIRKNFYSEKI